MWISYHNPIFFIHLIVHFYGGGGESKLYLEGFINSKPELSQGKPDTFHPTSDRIRTISKIVLRVHRGELVQPKICNAFPDVLAKEYIGQKFPNELHFTSKVHVTVASAASMAIIFTEDVQCSACSSTRWVGWEGNALNVRVGFGVAEGECIEMTPPLSLYDTWLCCLSKFKIKLRRSILVLPTSCSGCWVSRRNKRFESGALVAVANTISNILEN